MNPPQKTTGSGSAGSRTRVLIVKLSALGDLMHSLPVVHALKSGLDADIDWVTQDAYVELVSCFTDVDQVIGFPRHGFLRHHRRFLRELRSRSYDFIIDLQGLIKSGLVTRLARGRRRIGPSVPREGSRLFYTEVPAGGDPSRHAVDRAGDVLRHLGIAWDRREFPVVFPAPNLEGAAPHIALVPCSRWPTKNWHPARFADVGNRLVERTGGTVHLVGGPGDRVTCSAIAECIRGAENTCGRTSILEMASLLSVMDLVIAVDTGPMHVAAAAGTPILAVFGATDPRRTGPFSPRHEVLTTDSLACRPCLSRRCRRRDLACLTRIDADTVVETAERMLAGTPGRFVAFGPPPRSGGGTGAAESDS